MVLMEREQAELRYSAEPDCAPPLVSHFGLLPNSGPELWPSAHFGALFGPSVAMRELFARLARVAQAGASALIEGETGTGKELIARAIHDASARARGPFIVIDCGALQDGLLEAELFGHTKGAFTGATGVRAGALEEGMGGTVFLDEIGELPLMMQPKLLRVLESRTVRRLGENRHRAIDVRFISATHRNLGAMVASGRFREDLYFRLAAVPIAVPPLRERQGDVVALTHHFLQGTNTTIASDLLAELASRPWYGNVRELRNFLDCSRVLGVREALSIQVERCSKRPESTVQCSSSLLDLPFKQMVASVLAEAERSYVEGLLLRHVGNIARAAEDAGVHRSYLYRLIAKYQLRPGLGDLG
ncbi:MAG TPA: sigma-54 dependent transcriptional regulator [Polyangiaceae bacterium]|nr:sigma-54 dependent transcriptional regulator [Polyangiaceae bacterium]